MLQTHYLFAKKLSFWVEPARVFTELFAKQFYSFWLDSSMLAEGLSRFSFLGAIASDDRPQILPSHNLSRIVRYSVKTQQVDCLYPDFPEKNERKQQNIFDFLQQQLTNTQHELIGSDLPFAFDCGFVGYLGYELKADLTGSQAHKSIFPDAYFMQTDHAIAFDHLEKNIYLLCLLAPCEKAAAAIWFRQMTHRLELLATQKTLLHSTLSQKTFFQRASVVQVKSSDSDSVINQPFKKHWVRSQTDYLKDIEACQQKIRAGESYEICLTNSLSLQTYEDPLAYYLNLRQDNPAPYSAFLRFNDLSIACFSPERFLTISQQKNGSRLAESKPIKGTIKRSEHYQEDQALLRKLKNSIKDRAENLMIVDLVRNDLGMVCQPGSVHVDKLMAIETFAKVHQMVSTISGRLKPEQTSIDCIKALFPAGSMTGAPKIRTMEIIDMLEQQARGVYAGALGYIGCNGLLDLNVVIRTAVFQLLEDTQSGKLYQMTVNSGGAVTALSDPEQELAELLLKITVLVEKAL